MDAFANERFALEAFHGEDQAAAVHLGEFGLAADGRAHGTGFQVLDIDGNADGGVAFADFVAHGHQAGFLHQGDHRGGGEHLQCAGAIYRGGVFVLHHQLFAVTETGKVVIICHNRVFWGAKIFFFIGLPYQKKCTFANSRYNDSFMDNLTLYHGSTKVVERPELGIGNPKNDYGLGFYCTENLELAKEWASTEKSDGFANHYELILDGLQILRLNTKPYHILNWLSILLKNRTFVLSQGLPSDAKDYLLNHFLPDYEPYDLIVGYRADDSYFAFANAFLNNTISLEQLRKAMMLGNLGEQVVLKSERAFAQLHFIESIPVDSSLYYPRRMARDRQAREDFQNQKSMATASDAIYMIDILRQNWNNDDPRL